MEQKSYPKPPSPVRDMNAPTGIDLNPKPAHVVRVSKRAAFLGLSIVCGIGILLGYGIHSRGAAYSSAILGSDQEKNVAPATNAAAEITRNIPAGVVNLAAAETNNKVEATDEKSPENQPPAHAVTGAPPARRYMEYESAPQQAPTPEEQRLAMAYERELRAIASPTGIQAANPGVAQNTLDYPSSAPNGGDVSQLAALAQILSSRNGSSGQAAQATIDATADDQNGQGRKEAFLAKYRAVAPDDYLKSVRTPPLSQCEIKAGWEIPAVLEQAINSDLPGDLKALVTANVYDTATGRHLLIPQGSRLLGTYDSAIAYGQDGLQVVWNRIIFPDASSIDLGGMVGQDAHGASGLRHDVDNHYKRLIGFSVLSSIFSAGFQLSQSRRGSILQNPSPAEVAASSVGQSVSQVGAEVTRTNLNTQPTIKIPIGYKFNVRVNRDILFDSPYVPAQSK